MAEEHEQRESGAKGGAAEAHLTTVPTITAVTDITIPPDRVQWGPVFAGFLVALGVSTLWTGLGAAIGFAVAPTGFGGELGFWITGFAGLGLFLGAAIAARTAKTSRPWPAILHGVVIWSLLMMLDVFSDFGFFPGLRMLALGAVAGDTPAALVISDLGWWLFGGYLFLFVAAVFGGLAGMRQEHEEHHR